MTAFNRKKEEALAHLDMAALETALSLKQLCIEDRFEFAITPKFTTLSQRPNRNGQRSCQLHYSHLDIAARDTALKQLGVEDRFEFADHAKIY